MHAIKNIILILLGLVGATTLILMWGILIGALLLIVCGIAHLLFNF